VPPPVHPTFFYLSNASFFTCLTLYICACLGDNGMAGKEVLIQDGVFIQTEYTPTGRDDRVLV
jgi:hypothetical protein